MLWSLLYNAGALMVVSVLPRKLALIAIFSLIPGHYFGACTWLVFVWGLGMKAAIIYGIVLAVLLVRCGVGGPSPLSSTPCSR